MKIEDSVKLNGTRVTPEGYLEAFARTARTGTQQYRGREVGRPDLGIVTVYRDEKAVFDKETLAGFSSLPITIGHPAGGVKAEDWKKLAVGTSTGDVLRDGEHLKLGLKVMDADAVSKIQAGTRELSVGYDTELVWGPGVAPDGVAYDARQTNIRPNHIAIVQRGRAGTAMIGDEATQDGSFGTWGASPITSEDKEINDMTTRTILVDGLSVLTTDAGAQAIEKLQGVIATKDAAIDAKSVEVTALTKTIDSLTVEKVALEKKVTDSAITPQKMADMMKKRGKIIAKAKAISGEEPDESMEDSAIMRQAVAKYLGDDMPTEMSDERIFGAFHAIKAADAIDPIRQAFHSGLKTNDATMQANDEALFAASGIKMKKGA